MKIYLISDNIDTQTGFRLIGIDSVVVHESDEFKKTLDDVLKDKNIGILLVTEKHAQKYRDLLDQKRVDKKIPLVVVIPDRHGSTREKNFVTHCINDAIGIKF